ncbi:TPA: hypothetical protein SIC81_001923 [Pasteurella multocida]|nr:hypothetical protein [Pasteurella multocida]
MKYFDTKKSLPVLCSLLIVACSGGGGGGNNTPQSPIEKHAAVAPKTQKAAENPALAAQAPVVNKAVVAAPESIVSASVTALSTAKPDTIGNQPVTAIPAQSEAVKQVLSSQEEHNSIKPEWTGKEQTKYGARSWDHTPEKVPVFLLIPNKNHKYADDKLLELTATDIDLTKGKVPSEGNFQFSLVNSSVYSGYYLNSQDKMTVDTHFVIAFDKNKEYTKKDITADFYSEDGFNYAVLVGKTDYLRQVGNVSLFYKNGSVSGEIIDKRNNEVLFRFKNTIEKDPNLVQITPDKNNPHGLVSHGPDDMIMKMHFINGQNNEPYKYVVGSGKAERFYGTLFATKHNEEE